MFTHVFQDAIARPTGRRMTNQPQQRVLHWRTMLTRELMRAKFGVCASCTKRWPTSRLLSPNSWTPSSRKFSVLAYRMQCCTRASSHSARAANSAGQRCVVIELVDVWVVEQLPTTRTEQRAFWSRVRDRFVVFRCTGGPVQCRAA